MNPNPPAAPNYDEALVGDYTLPDPLVFNDGTPVRTVEDWSRRRAELLDLFRTHVYGRSPQPPARVLPSEVFDTDENSLGVPAIRKQITLHFLPNKQGPKMDVLIYVPAGAPTPVPLILAINFRGNHAVVSDPGVRLATVWDRQTGGKQQASEESRGQDASFDVVKILARGYGFATVCYQDIEPDFNGGYVHGIRPLFFAPGQSEPAPDDWGAIGAWAYGLSRVMDYLETDGDVDAGRVAILGHSRLGKTVLWAGAQDERFALILCSCSGEGGASLMRPQLRRNRCRPRARIPVLVLRQFRKLRRPCRRPARGRAHADRAERAAPRLRHWG
jgi:hypothetical protein